MRLDDAMREVRRLVWVAGLDHRQIAAINVVCQALESHRTLASTAETAPNAPDEPLWVE